MKHYWLLVGAMAFLFLVLFGIVSLLDIPILNNPGPWLEQGGWWTAIIGISLLIADVLLPTPASLIMIAHGAAFGVLAGTLISMIGGLGATWAGFYLGRRGGPLMNRLIPDYEQKQADAMLARWGIVAVIVTRPIPILAETTAIMAGASPSMALGKVTAGSIAGLIPATLLYALTGATAATLDNAYLIFGLVILVAGIFTLIGRRFGNQTQSAANESEG